MFFSRPYFKIEFRVELDKNREILQSCHKLGCKMQKNHSGANSLKHFEKISQYAMTTKVIVCSVPLIRTFFTKAKKLFL